MEQLNKITLRGTVGSAHFRTFEGQAQNRFSVVTNFAYKTRDGQAVIDTLWHNIIAWEGRYITAEQLRAIEKGCVAKVEGRLRLNKFVSTDGIEKQVYEVVANRVKIEDEEATTQMGY